MSFVKINQTHPQSGIENNNYYEKGENILTLVADSTLHCNPKITKGGGGVGQKITPQ